MADLIIILWIVLSLYGIKFCKGKNNFYEDYLSKNNTLVLKGVFSIVVIIHHLYYEFEPHPYLYKYFEKAGLWAVMYFLFISGYGVMYNYIHKDKYEKGFLKNRIKAIAPLYVIGIFVYWISYIAIGKNYSLLRMLKSIVDGSPLVLHSWYIIYILVFYLLFYIQMKVFKKNYLLIIISNFILCVLWVYLRKEIGFGEWWSNYVYSIPIGMLWALYKEDLDKIIHKLYWPMLLLFFFMFLESWRIEFYNDILYNIFNTYKIYRQSIVFPILVMIITMKFKVGNKALRYLGQISLETYIFHSLFTSVLFNRTSLPQNPLLFSILSLIASIILSSLIHYLYVKAKEAIIKRHSVCEIK